MLTEKFFIVYAQNSSTGRNGWAAVEAKNTREARKNAYNGWLDEAKVVDVQSWKNYTKNMSGDESTKLLKKIKSNIKKQGWHELEWGS